MNERASYTRRAAAGRRGLTRVGVLTIAAMAGIVLGLAGTAIVYSRSVARASTARQEARSKRQAVIQREIQDLAAALRKYRERFGEYPPDCAGLSLGNATAQAEFVQHLLQAYPRLDPALLGGGGTTAQFNRIRDYILRHYNGVDINYLSPQHALVFWLGGIPYLRDANKRLDPGKLMPLSTNPGNPFEFDAASATATPRQTPLFAFDTARLCNDPAASESSAAYSRPPLYGPGAGPLAATPYVYFKARQAGADRATFATAVVAGYNPFAYPIGSGVAAQACMVRYADGSNETVYPAYHATAATHGAGAGPSGWFAPQDFQILSAGADGFFGNSFSLPLGSSKIYPSPTNGLENDDLASFLTGSFANVQ